MEEVLILFLIKNSFPLRPNACFYIIGIVASFSKEGENMGTILEDVFLGTAEKYNQKLEMLARMAQPEKWTYKRIQDKIHTVS